MGRVAELGSRLIMRLALLLSRTFTCHSRSALWLRRKARTEHRGDSQSADDPVRFHRDTGRPLSSSHGLWVNGVYPTLDLPATASTEQVVARVFQMTGFDKGHVSSHRILETRQVRIGDRFPDATYTAVLVDTDLGRKIVLRQHSSPSGGWWSRVYDG